MGKDTTQIGPVGQYSIVLGGTDVGYTSESGIKKIVNDEIIKVGAGNALAKTVKRLRKSREVMLEMEILQIKDTALYGILYDLPSGQITTASGVTTVDATPQVKVTEIPLVATLTDAEGVVHKITATVCVDDPGDIVWNTDFNPVTLKLDCVFSSSDKPYEYTQTTADTTAPTVSTVSPADAATGVAVDADIVVTFSEDINSGDVTNKYGESYMVLDNSDQSLVAASATYNSGTYELTISPTSDLSTSTEYIVVVNKGLRDQAGNTLAAPFLSTFTTTS